MSNHRPARQKVWSWLILGAGLVSGIAWAGQDKTPLSIGTLRRMHSGILNEDRTLSVRLPRDYEKSRLSYPVIYLLYGDHTEGYFAETVFTLEALEGGAEIPDFLLVAIHNTDRYGDLLPVNFGGRPSGADAFLDFLEKELFPFVEAEYRTKPYRLLIGPQAGGPFGLYALTRRPVLFNAFILENPFSAPDSREVLKAGMRKYAAAPLAAGRSVFINSFDREGFQDHSEATSVLADFLKEFEPVKPAGLEIQRRHLEKPTFVPLLDLTTPLRSFFAGFYPPQEAKLDTLEKIQGYFREAGRKLGMEVDPPAFILTIICDELTRTGRTAAARELLEYSLSLRPDETNALFRLGNLFFGEGELDRAEEIFLRLQKIHPDPYFASRLEAIRLKRRKLTSPFVDQSTHS